MGTEYSAGFCEHCNDNVKTQRKTPNHIFHFVMSILTCGVWLLVWASVASEKDSWRCSRCGAKLGGGSNGWGLAGALLSKQSKPKAELMKKCPFCAEMIRSEAKICRFCQRDLSVDHMETPLSQIKKSDEESQVKPSALKNVKKHNNLNMFLFSLSLVFLCFLSIYFISQGALQKTKPTVNTVQEEETVQPLLSSSIIYTSDSDIFNSYFENEIKAASIYENMDIELTGQVSRISKNASGNGEIIFYIDDYKSKKILVEFDKKTTKKLSNITIGSFLTVMCKVKNFTLKTLFVEANSIVPR